MRSFSERPFKILTQYSLSQTSQFQVSVLEGVFHLVVQRLLFALDHDGGAAVQNPLWGSLHHQQVLGSVFAAIFVNGKLKKKDKKQVSSQAHVSMCVIMDKRGQINE